MIRHHRLLEAYLAEALGMPWDRVHDEAEVLEHYISEELEERMAAALGNPSFDPHGDPIPSRELDLEASGGTPAGPARARRPRAPSRGSRTPTRRCCATSPSGASCPGAALEVRERQPFGGPLTVGIAGAEHAIGGELAERMLVEVR